MDINNTNTNKIDGYCSLNNSYLALIADVNRKRENVVDNDHNDNNNDNNKDISIDILSGLHCYLLHPKDQYNIINNELWKSLSLEINDYFENTKYNGKK